MAVKTGMLVPEPRSSVEAKPADSGIMTIMARAFAIPSNSLVTFSRQLAASTTAILPGISSAFKRAVQSWLGWAMASSASMAVTA